MVDKIPDNSIFTDEDLDTLLDRLEKKHLMSSSDFAEQWGEGKTPNTFEFHLWNMLLLIRGARY